MSLWDTQTRAKKTMPNIWFDDTTLQGGHIMADFSPELFFDLAKYADKNDVYLKGHKAKLPGRFEDDDLPKIEAFKDAIFMVIMLRAARYMEITQQEKIADQTKRHALGHFAVILSSGDVHNDEKNFKLSFQQNILKMAREKSELFDKMGPIPRKTVRSILDDDISTKILDHFDNIELSLACKKPQ